MKPSEHRETLVETVQPYQDRITYLEDSNGALRAAMWDCYALLSPERVALVTKKTLSTLKKHA